MAQGIAASGLAAWPLCRAAKRTARKGDLNRLAGEDVLANPHAGLDRLGQIPWRSPFPDGSARRLHPPDPNVDRIDSLEPDRRTEGLPGTHPDLLGPEGRRPADTFHHDRPFEASPPAIGMGPDRFKYGDVVSGGEPDTA